MQDPEERDFFQIERQQADSEEGEFHCPGTKVNQDDPQLGDLLGRIVNQKDPEDEDTPGRQP
jgi:hypothetical protein